MSLAGAVFLILSFLILARILDIPARAAEVVARGRRALAELKDPGLSDRQKERTVRAHALRLLLLFFLITGSAAVSLGVPVAVLALLELSGLVELESVFRTTMSFEILAGAVVGAAAAALFSRRRRP